MAHRAAGEHISGGVVIKSLSATESHSQRRKNIANAADSKPKGLTGEFPIGRVSLSYLEFKKKYIDTEMKETVVVCLRQSPSPASDIDFPPSRRSA